MKTLKLFKSLDQIEVFGTNFDKCYKKCFSKSWEEIKNILEEYDITFPDPYQICFGDKYELKTTQKFLDGSVGLIFLNNKKIAKVYSIGSNVCDQELRMLLFLDTLKSLYDK